MPPPPEIAFETVAPAQLVERLDLLRERLRTGLMTVADFNAAIKAFQFKDDAGHLWAPGATTSQWYRWDIDKWTATEPPSQLRVPQAPVLFTDFNPTVRTPAEPAAPAGVICRNCGAENFAKKFCTKCGTKLG